MSIGAARGGADWDVASSSRADGWSIELRVRASAVQSGDTPARFALRTYNDLPSGWWSWPLPPVGTPAGAVERSPALWAYVVVR